MSINYSEFYKIEISTKFKVLCDVYMRSLTIYYLMILHEDLYIIAGKNGGDWIPV